MQHVQQSLERRQGVQGSTPSVEDDQGQDMNSVAPGFEREKEIGVLLTFCSVWGYHRSSIAAEGWGTHLCWWLKEKERKKRWERPGISAQRQYLPAFLNGEVPSLTCSGITGRHLPFSTAGLR